MLPRFSLMLSKRKIEQGAPRPLSGGCMVSCNYIKRDRSSSSAAFTSCSRLARAPREHTASPFLCVRMTRIQRGQDVHQRWTVKSLPAFCRAELAEPLSAISARTPALRSEINLPSANSVFVLIIILYSKCFVHFGFLSIIKILLMFNKFIDRKPSPVLFFHRLCQFPNTFWERARDSGVKALCAL